MVSLEIRALTFWGVCIPLRFYLASRGNDTLLRAAAALIGYRWLTGKEKARVGQFGGPAFWADERPVHGALWSSYALTGNSLFLYGDTLFGAANWLGYHIAV